MEGYIIKQLDLSCRKLDDEPFISELTRVMGNGMLVEALLCGGNRLTDASADVIAALVEASAVSRDPMTIACLGLIHFATPITAGDSQAFPSFQPLYRVNGSKIGNRHTALH